MTKDFKVIAIISGEGSNLKALLNNCKNCTFNAVISNKSTAPGLQFAKQLNIPTYTFDRSDYKNVKEQKSALFEKVIELAPDLVTLAGYMQIIAKTSQTYWQVKL
ncbi:MAG: formyltransferase family protein [Bdellovibrionota bacterium]